jgi:hypothetical protein
MTATPSFLDLGGRSWWPTSRFAATNATAIDVGMSAIAGIRP